MKKVAILLFVGLLLTQITNAQKISFSGHVGWSIPKGEAFTYDANSESAKGGIGYTADILYHLPKFEEKLAVGVVYNGAILFGGGSSDGSLSLGLYGLELYGVKGYYRFFKSAVSPYASLSTGLSKLETPEVTMNGAVVAEAERSFSLGIAPELGLELGGFTISAMFFTPMKYKVWAAEKQSAGSMQISLGYRYEF